MPNPRCVAVTRALCASAQLLVVPGVSFYKEEELMEWLFISGALVVAIGLLELLQQPPHK